MIIYNTIWLDNLQLYRQSDFYKNENCITNAEVSAIKNKYPVNFYTPGLFVRIGLFLLTSIIVLFSAVFLILLLSSAYVIDGFGWPLTLGVIIYIILEAMVKKNNHYKSGVDDALLWISGSFLIGSFIWLVTGLDRDYAHDHLLIISLFIFVLTTGFSLRFADLIMSAMASVSFFSVIFFVCKTIGAIGIEMVPFVLIISALICYLLTPQLNKIKITKYYQNCILMFRLISLLVFYLAGNYYVIDNLGEWFTGNVFTIHKIHYGAFFWLWTILLPFVYVIKGLYSKDTTVLRTGLILLGAAAVTFRNYYHLLPTELALTLAGSFLLILVYTLIKYLKVNKRGFTYADNNTSNVIDHLKVESILLPESMKNNAQVPAEAHNRFGGGDFGGGGSGGRY